LLLVLLSAGVPGSWISEAQPHTASGLFFREGSSTTVLNFKVHGSVRASSLLLAFKVLWL
jgi:hypothetical protein